MSEKIWCICIVQWHYKTSIHFHFILITNFLFCLFSLWMYAVIYTYFPLFPSSLISSNDLLVLQWGTQGEGVNIFHFRNFQRSFISVYKGQNTKLLMRDRQISDIPENTKQQLLLYILPQGHFHMWHILLCNLCKGESPAYTKKKKNVKIAEILSMTTKYYSQHF